MSETQLETQRHHYVPQFLLRPWCTTKGDSPAQLWSCYRLETGELAHRRYSPKSVAAKTNLYRIEGGIRASEANTNPSHIEEAYSRLESAAAKIHAQLVDGIPPSRLREEERACWAQFIRTLQFRGPRCVRSSEETMLEWAQGVIPRLFGDSPEFECNRTFLESLDLTAMAKNSARALPLREKAALAAPILDWHWNCAHSSDIEFVTSDHPVVTWGDDARDVILTLPLTPKCLFIGACAPLDEEALTRIAVSNDIQLISQKPNFIFSRSQLADNSVTKPLLAANEFLERPD